MLIKEYRIPLPLTVDEYKIAQLYMIAKKSREESKGAGSGVEILYNEPYDNDEEAPGTKGQKTVKIYHVGSHLPGWIKSLLPKSALEVKAWTDETGAVKMLIKEYRIPLPLTVDEYKIAQLYMIARPEYLPDDGSTDNVFQLSGSDLRSRIVEVIDVVKDQLYGGDYVREEDPSIYVSKTTGRGPLSENWISEYWNAVKEDPTVSHDNKSMMCAYKLCKIQLNYWGIQSKVERFIADTALRKTMLRAHRQAWAWQDEWNGLNIEDIRKIERDTAEALKLKMSGGANGTDIPSDGLQSASSHSTAPSASTITSAPNPALKTLADALDSIEKSDSELQQHVSTPKPASVPASASSKHLSSHSSKLSLSLSKTPGGPGGGGSTESGAPHKARSTLHSPSSVRSFEAASWRMESLMRDSEDSDGISGAEDEDDEFFDAQESMGDNSSLAKWSSMELLNEEDESPSPSVASRQGAAQDRFVWPRYDYLRRLSEVSIVSSVSGVNDNLPLHTINALTQKWWGSKRIDYALYCPEGLANFPTNALPHLFHASFWESCDVIAFILRQIGRFDMAPAMGTDDKDLEGFNPGQPREKWIRKRTSVKIKNATANHRANDVIVKEGLPQTLVARFMYGPFDMFTLTGEKVDVHLIKEPPSGEWVLMSTEVTDKTGRVSYTLPEDHKLSYGMYPVKMVVRGDHTSVDFYLAVVPPRTEVVVFSVDGSFTASVSVTGRDPKVRAGAVDIVRHWQELGYLIIYITGRPDMQQGRVLSWLSQHNFPHGLVSFADGLSPGFLGHKASYLKSLIQDHGVVIHAAYGSNKDVSVYTSVGLKPRSIYIVGKVSKKHQSQATVLSDGYAAHLTALQQHGGSRPAQGNARMVLAPKGYFGHNLSIRRRRSAKRTVSFPLSPVEIVPSSSLPNTPNRRADKL
ncbi:protein retinal degeneration B [Diaphorina citri]|uniref:Protein retinal degeneration B n=1 Tax=Diaphorina citri TaxID=121845 RepID=A0A3Q0J430_DIACI|nr:protein retinal degeneration B [Diaphorina citri]